MMYVSEAVASRRSIRAFTAEPVALEVLRRVFDKARIAPSGCNFQPWEATVLTGEPLRELQARMMVAAPQDPVDNDIQPADMGAVYMDRFRANGARMYESMNIQRGDGAARKAFVEGNTLSFNAPAVMVCYFPRNMGPPQWSDVGMWLQTIMLLLREEGLASCPQEFLSIHARLIKDFIGVSDESHLLFCGMAIGHADMADPVNNFERERAPLDETVRFLGF